MSVRKLTWSYRCREKRKEAVILWGADNFSTIIDFLLPEKGESGLIHAYLVFTSPSTAIDIKSESSNLFFIVCTFGSSMQRTNTQFLCFLHAPRGDGTQGRNQWNEPPGAETEWSSKSELMPLNFAYPSPGPKGWGYNWLLHLLCTSNWLSLAVFFGAGEGGYFWQRAL